MSVRKSVAHPFRLHSSAFALVLKRHAAAVVASAPPRKHACAKRSPRVAQALPKAKAVAAPLPPAPAPKPATPPTGDTSNSESPEDFLKRLGTEELSANQYVYLVAVSRVLPSLVAAGAFWDISALEHHEIADMVRDTIDNPEASAAGGRPPAECEPTSVIQQ